MREAANYSEVLTKEAESLQPKVENSEEVAVEDPRAKHIGGYFPLKVYRLLKVIGAENELSTRELLVKALNMLFQLYGKPPMAE